MTFSVRDWEAIHGAVRDAPERRWAVELASGARWVGRVAALPNGPPSSWTPSDRLTVVDGTGRARSVSLQSVHGFYTPRGA